jgi:hypothetical protein
MLRNSRWRYRRRACSAGHSDSEGAATIAPPRQLILVVRRRRKLGASNEIRTLPASSGVCGR